MNLPGQEEARALGYELVSFSADRSSADYFKDGVTLSIREDDSAMLTAVVKSVVLSSGPIQFPHTRFDVFERNICGALRGAEAML